MRMCEESISHIHMLVEEELEAQAAERLREHMGDCRNCSRQFEEFGQMKKLGEEALSAELGDVDIADGFLKKLSESEAAKRRPGSFMRWVWIPLAVAAAVILVAIASSIFRPGWGPSRGIRWSPA